MVITMYAALVNAWMRAVTTGTFHQGTMSATLANNIPVAVSVMNDDEK